MKILIKLLNKKHSKEVKKDTMIKFEWKSIEKLNNKEWVLQKSLDDETKINHKSLLQVFNIYFVCFLLKLLVCNVVVVVVVVF